MQHDSYFFGTEMAVLLGYTLGLMGIYIIGCISLVPLKILGKICINSFLGFLCILIFNVVFGRIGFHIGINLLTSLTAGILGVPGFALLMILSL